MSPAGPGCGTLAAPQRRRYMIADVPNGRGTLGSPRVAVQLAARRYVPSAARHRVPMELAALLATHMGWALGLSTWVGQAGAAAAELKEERGRSAVTDET
jgi:hypothetical protein